MITTSEAKAASHGKYTKVAYDRKSNLSIYVTRTEDTYPIQTPSTSVLDDLISKEKLNILRKRYSVPKSVIRSIRSSYENQSEYINLPDGANSDLSTQLFIDNIESHIIRSLKKEITLPKADLQVFYPSNVRSQFYSTIVLGASSSGKDWWVVDQVLSPSLKDKLVIYFSMHAHDDSTVLRLIKERKNASTHVRRIDLKALAEDKIVFKLSDLPDDCIVCFSDIESLPDSVSGTGTYSVKKMLYRLAESVYSSGRHRGILSFFIAHSSTQGRGNIHFVKLRREASIVVCMIAGSKAPFMGYLQRNLGMSKGEIAHVFEKSKGSRFIALQQSNPEFALSKSYFFLRD